MSSKIKPRVLYENLDTAFVNLWALLRNLSQKGFVGRVHVELQEYTADVFLNGSNRPLVHEVDRAAGSDVTEESALHRLVLRARESAGSITVFEGADETRAAAGGDTELKSATAQSAVPAPEILPEQLPSAAPQDKSTQPLMDTPGSTAGSSYQYASRTEFVAVEHKSAEWIEWSDVVKLSGELVGAVERALNASGADFASTFRAARLALADDYTFLDPMGSRLEYSNGVVTVTDELPVNGYVAALSETLRRVVDKAAGGDRARRLRERVALELALVARKRGNLLQVSGFLEQLDRIAGTKVI